MGGCRYHIRRVLSEGTRVMAFAYVTCTIVTLGMTVVLFVGIDGWADCSPDHACNGIQSADPQSVKCTVCIKNYY